MKIRKFQPQKDLQRLEAYLRNQYMVNRNMTSWLPERLHDLIYRMGAQEVDGGRKKSVEYIFLWEENEEIVACILPDGDAIYMSIKNGFEHLFSTVLTYAEQNCLPLFKRKRTALWIFGLLQMTALLTDRIFLCFQVMKDRLRRIMITMYIP